MSWPRAGAAERARVSRTAALILSAPSSATDWSPVSAKMGGRSLTQVSLTLPVPLLLKMVQF